MWLKTSHNTIIASRVELAASREYLKPYLDTAAHEIRTNKRRA